MLRSFPAPKQCGGCFNATGDWRQMCVVKYPRKVKIFVTLVNSATNRADRKGAVTAKCLATGFTGVIVVGAAAAGVTSIAPVGRTAGVAE
jgi:hypothetical protein